MRWADGLPPPLPLASILPFPFHLCRSGGGWGEGRREGMLIRRDGWGVKERVMEERKERNWKRKKGRKL